TLPALALAPPVDGRQSATALAVARGSTRLLHSLAFSVVSELPLGSGRRADLVALGPNGEIWSLRSSPRSPLFAPTRNCWTIAGTATVCSSLPRSRCRARFPRPIRG